MTNTNLLKSTMVAAGDENFVQRLTEILGCSRTTASYKLNGKISFTQDEITKLTRQYKLTGEDIINIFVGKTDEGGEHDEPI